MTEGSPRKFPIAPLVLFALTLGGIFLIQSRSDVDRNIRAWITTAAVAAGILAQAVWVLAFSRWRWWKRLAILAGAALVFAAVRLTTRVDGSFSGIGLPRLVWRWTPTRDQLAQAHWSSPSTNTLPNYAPTNSVAPSPQSPAVNPALSQLPNRLIHSPAASAQSLQFLGSQRNNRIDGVALARDWTASPPKELWRRPIGLGWSAFAIDQGLAITQEQRGELEAVAAYSLLSGEPVWLHTDEARFREWQGGDGPRATPTIVSNRVITLGATGLLNCLDQTTGKRLWSVNILTSQSLNNLSWGKSSSPLVLNGRVYVTGGTTDARSLLAYSISDGQLLWSAGDNGASYASPTFATLAGIPQILTVGVRTISGHDPQSGAKLWDFAWGNEKPPKCSQPLVIEGSRVFLSAGYGMGCTLIEVNASKEGILSAKELWKTKTMKTQFNNVAERNGHLYGLDDGFLACIHLQDGKRLWKDGRYGSGQSLLVGDLILVQAEPGFIALAEATPTAYRELGRIQALNSKTWNNPTLAGPYLLVRNDLEAVCYQLPLATP